MLALTSPLPAKTQGFTLIELMVVLALVAIIATFAVPSFQSAMARQKVNIAASDLLVSATQARSEAIKNNRQAIVQPVSDQSDWSQGWRIYVDMDNSKTYTEGDLLVTTVPAAASSTSQRAGTEWVGLRIRAVLVVFIFLGRCFQQQHQLVHHGVQGRHTV